MSVPTSINEIHYRMFLDLLEAKEDGFGFYGEPEKSRLKAIEKLLKGKVKVLGFYDAYYKEKSKMEVRIEKLLENKGRTFCYIYTLPNEDGEFLIVTKVPMNMWKPWRRIE